MYTLDELSNMKKHMVNGYYRYYIPNHHLAGKSGCVYEHMLVAETMLGRELKDSEVVHHIDGNRANNSPDNLMVFKTKADHTAYHGGCKVVKDGDVYTAIRNNYTTYKDGKKHFVNTCPICGKEKNIDAKLCMKCREKIKSKNIPSKEKLIEALKNNSFVAVGRMFNVSDNAVRNWCKKYGLPYRTKEVKEFLAS